MRSSHEMPSVTDQKRATIPNQLVEPSLSHDSTSAISPPLNPQGKEAGPKPFQGPHVSRQSSRNQPFSTPASPSAVKDGPNQPSPPGHDVASSAWSPPLQTLLDQPPATFPLQVLATGLGFGAVFAIWACVGTLQEVSNAQGHLIPQGDVYKVQPMVQGEVSAIFVQEGDEVKAGQKIVACDPQLVQADLDQLQEQLLGYQRKLVQTQGLLERTHLEAQAHQLIAQADIRAQQAQLSATVADIAMVNDLMGQLHQDVEAYEQRLGRLMPLVEDGAIAEDNLFEIEQALRDRTQALIRNQGEVEKQQAEMTRLTSALQQSQANGQRSAIESQQKIQQYNIEVAQIESEMTRTETLIQSAKTKLQQMTFHAPTNGTVLSLDIKNIGEVVQPGQTIAELAPSDSPLVLSAILPSREAGLVEAGMQVNMKFDAFPYQDYGILSGEVTSISPDAIIDQQMGSVYEINVDLSQNYVMHEDEKVDLKAGQTASAEIVVRQRRIIDVLLDPIRQLQKSSITL